MYRNYEYISQKKLEIYYPQFVGTEVNKRSKKIGISGGIAKFELSEEKSSLDADHGKIEIIIDKLKERKLLGGFEDDKPWIEGDVSAKAIMHFHDLFFCSSYETDEYKVYVIMLASPHHLIGADYSREKIENLSYFDKRSPVGHLGIEYFEQNSNSLGYAWRLRDAYEAEKHANRIDFEFDSSTDLLSSEYKLTNEEVELLEKKKDLNNQFKKIWQGELAFFFSWKTWYKPASSWLQRIINIFRKPIIKMILGRELYEQKMKVIKKHYAYKKLDKERLNSDEKKILNAAYGTATSCLDGYERRYTMVARRLLSGFMDDKRSGHDKPVKVEIISPLYMASV